MTLGQLLDRTFRLVLRRLPLFAGIMIPAAMIQISVELAASALGPAPALGDDVLSDPQSLVAQIPVLAAVSAVQLVTYWIVTVIALAAVSRAVADLEKGGAGIAGAYRDLPGRSPTLLALTLVFLLISAVAIAGAVLPAVVATLIHPVLGLLAGLGAAALFFGGYLTAVVWLGLAVPAACLERLPVNAALRRSVSLVRGRFGRVLGLVVLTVIAGGAVALIVQGPFVLLKLLAGAGGTAPAWAQVLVTLSGGVAMILSSPLLLVGLAVAYRDASAPGAGAP